MKRIIVYSAAGIVFQTLNAALLQTIFPYGLLPDFILIMVFYLGFRGNSIEGVIASFLMGLIADIFSAGVMGTASFGLVIIFAAVHLLSKKMSFNTMPIKVGWTFIMAILKTGLIYLVLRILLFDRDVPFYAFAIPSAVITAVLSPFVFNLLDRIERFIGSARGLGEEWRI